MITYRISYILMHIYSCFIQPWTNTYEKKKLNTNTSFIKKTPARKQIIKFYSDHAFQVIPAGNDGRDCVEVGLILRRFNPNSTLIACWVIFIIYLARNLLVQNVFHQIFVIRYWREFHPGRMLRASLWFQRWLSRTSICGVCCNPRWVPSYAAVRNMRVSLPFMRA